MEKSKAKAHALEMIAPNEFARIVSPQIHIYNENVICRTDSRGHATPGGQPRISIVVDSSEGFIPLWAEGITLRWRFNEASMKVFKKPDAAKSTIEDLMGRAILAWEDAAPVRFAKRDDAWDFEVVMKRVDECDPAGCVLASAFFPDAGRHELVIYPKLFEQSDEEQVETLVHEIGHIFGLRHFFANVRETAWSSEIFGVHEAFSIMNYGVKSMLTENDKADLKKLYQLVWNGELNAINGTPIRLQRPYHLDGIGRVVRPAF